MKAKLGASVVLVLALACAIALARLRRPPSRGLPYESGSPGLLG